MRRRGRRGRGGVGGQRWMLRWLRRGGGRRLVCFCVWGRGWVVCLWGGGGGGGGGGGLGGGGGWVGGGGGGGGVVWGGWGWGVGEGVRGWESGSRNWVLGIGYWEVWNSFLTGICFLQRSR